MENVSVPRLLMPPSHRVKRSTLQLEEPEDSSIRLLLPLILALESSLA